MGQLQEAIDAANAWDLDSQLEQAMVQRTGTAHGISIRVFVAEDQNFIRSQ